MSILSERIEAERISYEINSSNYDLGTTRDGDRTIFKLFCPRSPEVHLQIFREYEEDALQSLEMRQDEEGCWYIAVEADLLGYYYGYDITSPETKSSDFIPSDHPVADPYSRWVTIRNNYRQEPLTKIVETDDYDWEGDQPIEIDRYSDLVIYESHIKDMTWHDSAGSERPGTYKGFAAENQQGGIAHLKKMGVNAVEFLPLQKYAYFEPPYHEMTEEGIRNHWNPYARNHWGYMPSFFFVPESRFATNATIHPNEVCGINADAIDEFKDMVKALHREGIAVIIDVVYNHVSQYDWNPLKYIDKSYYFRLNEQGDFNSDSGCGNDFKTESPMAQKLIVDSIAYWMEEFHVDGFRFDLAPLIDWETMDAIREKALSINPNAVLIAEPWGAGYDPNGYSEREMGAWNDKIRNGLKGSHPIDDPGFVTGNWQFETNRETLQNLIRGTLVDSSNGLFNHSDHSVNYLESHDGYTFGDFLRIFQDHSLINRPIKDYPNHVELNEQLLRKAKLGALFLFVSQGIVMMHQGQEWARSKVIAETDADDPHQGQLDHDSYNKDNATNHLNFEEQKLNASLVDYYRGLIKLRKRAPALRHTPKDHIHFMETEEPLHLAFLVEGTPSGDDYDYFIALNGNSEEAKKGSIPEGQWEMIIDSRQAGTSVLGSIEENYDLPASSGFVCRRAIS